MKPATAKRKGAETEQVFVDWLRDRGIRHAERRHLSGAHDKGDIAGWPMVCIEVKSGAKLAIPQWLGELTRETINSKAAVGALVIRPKGMPHPTDWWVVQRTDRWLDLMKQAGYTGGNKND
jgi:hypothetical protein